MTRLAGAILLFFALMALFADCLAGDAPILLSRGDQLLVFDRARSESGEELSRLGAQDWALWPPVRHDPQAVRSDGRLDVLEPPSAQHWLGTDDRGRDVLSRLIHGSRLSLLLAFSCASLATALGLALAFLAVLYRPLDPLAVSLCDILATIPVLLMVMTVRGLTGSDSFAAVCLLIALPRAASCARLLRDGLLQAWNQPFCQAARALGNRPSRVLARHALPQCWTQLRVSFALSAATAVLAEVALSFLGLGIAGSAPSWGELFRQAHENQLRYWLLLPGGLCTASVTWSLSRLAGRAT